MNKLTIEGLKEVKGGAPTLSGVFMKGIVDLITCLFEAGKAAGTALRRYKEDLMCPLS
ncbi:MAG: hypothetical protein RSE91_04100 [Bacilli bacterium]